MPVVRPLRLVEMQLMTTAVAKLEEGATGSDPPAAEVTAAMAEYEARRCIVCDCRHPSFGFGPPLHSNSKGTIWACGTHRAEVDRRCRVVLAREIVCRERDAPLQPSLF